MSMSMRQSMHRPRRHGSVLGPADRRVLERSGWRTTLDYRENHVRSRDGRLLEVIAAWTAEAERFDGATTYVTAVGATPEDAWAQLRADIADNRVTTLRSITLLPAR